MDSIEINTGCLSVRPSTLEDVCSLRARLRDEDCAEVWAASHWDAEKALLFAYGLSERRLTILRSGTPIAMFGVARSPDQPAAGNVWLLGSPEISAVPLSFVRITKNWTARFLEEFPVLYNWVDCRYEKAIKWLKILGAEFSEPAPFGEDGLPFRRFVLQQEVSANV